MYTPWTDDGAIDVVYMQDEPMLGTTIVIHGYCSHTVTSNQANAYMYGQLHVHLLHDIYQM